MECEAKYLFVIKYNATPVLTPPPPPHTHTAVLAVTLYLQAPSGSAPLPCPLQPPCPLVERPWNVSVGCFWLLFTATPGWYVRVAYVSCLLDLEMWTASAKLQF